MSQRWPVSKGLNVYIDITQILLIVWLENWIIFYFTGLKALNLYFNIDRFNLWFDSLDDSDNEVDFSVLDKLNTINNNDEISDEDEKPRTISSLAAEVEREGLWIWF